jgi:PsbP-like protein
LKEHIYVIILLASVVLVSGCVNQGNNTTINQTILSPLSKTYTQNNITFEYPESWQELNSTEEDVIAFVEDPLQKGPDGEANVFVQVMKKESKGAPLRKVYDEIRDGTQGTPGFQQISDQPITIDGLPAYELVAKATKKKAEEPQKNSEEYIRLVVFEKDGFIYMIACGTRTPANFNEQNRNFDLVITTFKFQ